MRLIFILSCFIILGACQTDGARKENDKGTPRKNWTQISTKESKLSAPKHILERVKEIKVNSSSDRHKERILIKAPGFAILDWKFNGGFIFPISNETFYKLFVGLPLYGQKVSQDEITIHEAENIQYATLFRHGHHCMAFIKGLGPHMISNSTPARSANLHGLVCSEISNQHFFSQMLDDLSNTNLKK